MDKMLKKDEAIQRMKKMDIYGRAREAFRRSGRVMCSEPPFGGLYDLNDQQKAVAKRLADENNALVYLVVRSKVEDMLMDSYFYVSDHEEEWPMDNDDIHEGYAVTWTENLTHPEYSEFGTIGFRSRGGGVIRVA